MPLIERFGGRAAAQDAPARFVSFGCSSSSRGAGIELASPSIAEEWKDCGFAAPTDLLHPHRPQREDASCIQATAG